MKKYLLSGLTLAALITSGTAAAYDLKDTYIGGNDPRDVIGGLSDYDTLGLNASLEGSILTVEIHTNFAGRAEYGYGSYQTQTEASGWGNGIGYGDLFLSSGDSEGGWEYGFSIDDRWSETGGYGNLFALSGSNDDFLFSDDFLSTGDFRHGEAVAVNTGSSTVDQIGTGSWSVSETDRIISFALDLSGTGLGNSDGITLGWGMTCANDLIYGTVLADTQGGATSVPEPGALGLVGLGLLGTMVGRRRRKTA